MKPGILIILSLIFVLFYNTNRAGEIPLDLDSTQNISSFSIIVVEEPPKDSVGSRPAPTKTMRTLMKKTKHLFIND